MRCHVNSKPVGLTLWLSLVALVEIACGDPTPRPDPSTRRTLAEGQIVGTTVEEGAVHAWKGIPFAQPPTGVRRWRAPQPSGAWEGVREALVSGSECSQLGGDPILGNEDCLYLDVFAPAMEAVPGDADRLPVMYWIHGGGNSIGAGHQLPPSALARDNGVIVVTINYRLGAFGFLKVEGGDANCGLADQAAALAK